MCLLFMGALHFHQHFPPSNAPAILNHILLGGESRFRRKSLSLVLLSRFHFFQSKPCNVYSQPCFPDICYLSCFSGSRCLTREHYTTTQFTVQALNMKQGDSQMHPALLDLNIKASRLLRYRSGSRKPNTSQNLRLRMLFTKNSSRKPFTRTDPKLKSQVALVKRNYLVKDK